MNGPTRSPTGPHAKWLTASQTAAAGQAPSHHTPAVAAQRAGPLISDLARSRRGRSSPGTTPRARDSRMCFLAGCVRSWVRPVLRRGSRTSSIPQATVSAALSGCRHGARLRRWRLGPPTRAPEKATPLARGTLEWDSNAYDAGTLASRDCLAATAPPPPPRPLHVYSRCGGLPRRAGRERSPRHDAGRVCRSAPTARIHDPPHRTGCLARDPVGPPRGRDGKARPARMRRV